MDSLSCIIECLSLIVVLCGLILLRHLIKHTKNITNYLCVFDGLKKYSIISQRIRFDGERIKATRIKCKCLPIKEKISEFGKEFRDDFDKLFDNLQPNVNYRVTTHYGSLMEKAVRDGRIQLISQPKLDKKRTLRELRPLLGFRDYILVRKCIRKHPHKLRCCKNCRIKAKCKCTRGGVCPAACKKKFLRYDFIVLK